MTNTKTKRGPKPSFPGKKTAAFMVAIPAATLKRFRTKIKRLGVRFNMAVDEALGNFIEAN